MIALLLVIVLTSSSFAAPEAAERQLPFKGSIEALETYEVDFPLMSVAASGAGTATYLGRFAVSYTVEEVNLLTNAGTGEAIQFVAANGDSLFAEGLGQATETGIPGVFNVVEHYTITGGTGRFAGASGNITTDRIVDITTGITSGTISGNIVLP